MAQTWQKFEEIVLMRLTHKYWGLEVIRVQQQKRRSKPDFIIDRFWGIFRVIADAKHKDKLTNDDIDKLVRDSKIHESDWNHLYISTTTQVPEDVAIYAKKKEIEIYRLGWNGREIRVI